MKISRYGHIDSIRALAAITVIYFHIANEFLRKGWVVYQPEHGIFIAMTHFLDLGKFGVILFFCVSGFVIPFSLLNGKRHTLRDFVVSRFFRLYPAYWLSIPFGIYIFYIAMNRACPTTLILLNVTMLQQFFNYDNIIGLYWTLQVELIFYALCIALFVSGYLRRARSAYVAALAMLAFAICLAVARYALEKKFPVALPLALSAMFFGMLWRRRQFEEDALMRRLSASYLISFLVVLPVVCIFGYNRDLGHDETWYRYTITYFAAILAFLLLTTRWKIRSPKWAYLGRISYSLYLFAAVPQAIMLDLLPPDKYPFLPGHFYILATIAATIGISSFTYRFVEQPTVALGRRVNAWLDERAGDVSPATEVV